MIIIFFIAPLLICAVICFLQAFIHETGHYLKIRKWAKKLHWDISGISVYIGDENSSQLLKIGAFRIMSKGAMKKGTTVSPFYKQLALYKGKDRNVIIRDNAEAGAKAILKTGFAMLYFLQAAAILNSGLFNTSLLWFYVPLTVIAAVVILLIFKNSFGAENEYSDLSFWYNPQKFVDYFKDEV